MLNLRWHPERHLKTHDIRLVECDRLLRWAHYQNHGPCQALDIGCGSGLVDHHLAQTYPQMNITAIDDDEGMIQYAQEHYPHRHLKFALMKAQAIQLDQPIDLAISLACLQWVREQDQVLQGVYQALKSGGEALFLLYPKQPYLWKVLDHITHSSPWQPLLADLDDGYCSYDPDTYLTLARQSGFVVKKIETVKEANFGFANQEAFETLLASWLPHLTRIPNEQHATFLREISDQVLALLKQDGFKGFPEYPVTSLRVHLTKP